MRAERSRKTPMGPDVAAVAPVPPETEESPAWELVDTGRYRPRRIRGSLRGRELG